MENASKALMMAGGVLLAIALLSLMVYIFKVMAMNSANIYSEYDNADINQFNQKFLNFEGKTDLLAQDIVTAINYAKDNDKTKAMPVNIIVKLDGTKINDYDTGNFMINNIKKKFTCEKARNSDYTELGVLKEIRFITN